MRLSAAQSLSVRDSPPVDASVGGAVGGAVARVLDAQRAAVVRVQLLRVQELVDPGRRREMMYVDANSIYWLGQSV